MPTVEVSRLAKKFGAVTAVRDVSFTVEPGEIFGLLGPNGAGKTTTIRMMLDIFRPDQGAVRVFGRPLDLPGRRRIGYLPEERGLYKSLKLEPTLIYLARLKGMDAKEARRRLTGWLERFDLAGHRHNKIEELSKGMQQKAQIISTMLHDPELIIIDEPFTALDPVNTRLVKQVLAEQQAAGKTIIMSTHQMYQVEALCDRIVLIDNGQTVLYGLVNEIKRNFAGNAVYLDGQADFNHLPGVLETRKHNGSWHMTLAAGADPKGVLQAVANQAGSRIERFELAEPSLEDIFINVVSGDLPSEPYRNGKLERQADKEESHA